MSGEHLLEVEDLRVSFATEDGVVRGSTGFRSISTPGKRWRLSENRGLGSPP